jgi:hypothetical protein
MRESRTSGFVRGAHSNMCPYRDRYLPRSSSGECDGLAVLTAKYITNTFDLGDGGIGFPGCHWVLRSISFKDRLCGDLEIARNGPLPAMTGVGRSRAPWNRFLPEITRREMLKVTAAAAVSNYHRSPK